MQASSPVAAPRLSEQLFTLFRRFLLDPQADHFRAIEEHDLTVSQVRALMLLACSDPEPLPGGRIAELLGISPAAISRALDGLVRDGLALRRESVEDRRVRPLAITGAGREVADQLSTLRRAQLERFVGDLDSDQRAALAVALDAVLADGGPS